MFDKNSKVFIVGGKLTKGPTHSLSQHSYIVDLTSNRIEVCSPPITTRFNPSVFCDTASSASLSLSSGIVLFGGEDDKYRLAPCIELFNLSTRQWSEIATIPGQFGSIAFAFVT